MKKLSCLTLICLTCILTQAQKVIPGFKGGLNVANVSNLYGDNRISGHIGLFLHTSIAKDWAFQPEILYSGQGQKYWVNNDIQYTWALNYINIPLMFQYYPVHRFYLEAGPQLGILVAARNKGPNGYNANIIDRAHKADATLNFGMGYYFNRTAGAYMRYGLGLSDITPDDVDRYTYSNRVFQLGVEIRLH
ncbi:MAG: PorT family protein [Chitinophagaceae bacterium]|nr:PorT family protein [Chitinophagaceae bacterium]